ncbi:YbaN family protein [Methanobacterium movens]
MEPKRVFFFSLGVTLLGVGAIGAVLPVLPTTPLVIASAFCFGKSSKRAERWISRNRYFGSYINNYKTKKGVPQDVKLKSLVFLWVMLIASMLIANQGYLYILLMVVGMGVSAHILLLKTMVKEEDNL